MKVRVTYVVEKGSPVGLVKHAIEGEVVECDRVEFDHGVLILWRTVRVEEFYAAETIKEMPDGELEAAKLNMPEVLVKAFGPGTYRTVVPLPVGAGDQPEKPAHEDPPGRSQERRSVRAP
jgi:hypothetical protein